jgi:hypothetical protein
VTQELGAAGEELITGLSARASDFCERGFHRHGNVQAGTFDFCAILAVFIWLIIKLTKPTTLLKKEWTEEHLDAATVAVVVALVALGSVAKRGGKRLAEKVEPTETAKLEYGNCHDRAGIDWVRLCLLVIVWSVFTLMLTIGAFMILAFLAHRFFPESGFHDFFLVAGSGLAFISDTHFQRFHDPKGLSATSLEAQLEAAAVSDIHFRAQRMLLLIASA